MVIHLLINDGTVHFRHRPKVILMDGVTIVAATLGRD